MNVSNIMIFLFPMQIVHVMECVPVHGGSLQTVRPKSSAVIPESILFTFLVTVSSQLLWLI